MKIETYEVEEINASEASTMAADGEALLLVEKLGLAGQRKLANMDTGTRLPYRMMTALEKIVFELHCPRKTKLEDYASSIIPVRVLQVAAYCRDGGFFKRLEVWHPEDAKLDPVLVGYTQETAYGTGSGDLFLLARWGEVWKDFAQLVTEAKAMWIATQKSKFSKAKTELAGDEASLEAVADSVFSTGRVQSFCYSGW